MADPLSTVGAVVGVASLGIQVTQSLIDFYNAYKSQKSYLANILRNLENLKDTLQMLEKLWVGRTLTEYDQTIVERIQRSTTNCKEVIDELRDNCQRFARSTQPGLKETFNTIKHQIAYPLKRTTLQKLNIDITDIRDDLAFLLDVVQLKAIKRSQDDFNDMNVLLESVNSGQISLSLQRWLSAPDATVDHNAACRKKYPGSGTWLLKNPEFSNWLAQENSYLWVKGFAGSGKSVLCSTAIQTAFRHRRNNRNIGIAFFYFTFNDKSKQDESSMIRALLWQLSNQVSEHHTDLLQLYEKSKAGMPPSTVLLMYLRQLIGRFHRTYIFLDALDECPRTAGRKGVLETLEEMYEWDVPRIQLFATSRDEPDIRQRLGSLADSHIEMRNTGIDSDIANFVSSQLNEDKQLFKLSKYHNQIQKVLTEGAKGVFRWVECQLESLKLCPRSLFHVQNMLKSLPETLDATYERMLCNIDSGLIEDARRILTLLCFAYRPLTVQELIDAIAVDICGQVGLDYSHKLEDMDDIRNICSGFIDIDDGGDPVLMPDSDDQNRSTVRIAHFSVQEYLISTRIRQSKAKIFSIDKLSAHAEIAQICLIYLLEDGLYSPHFDERLVKQFPLSHFAATYWHRHYKDAAEFSSTLDTFVLNLFQNQQPFVTWIRLHNSDQDWDNGINFNRPTNKVMSPIYYASLLGLGETLSTLVNEYPAIAISKKINLQRCGRYSNALQAASSKGYRDLIQLLLDKGADINAQGGFHGNALQAASSKGYRDLVQLLLDKGADINAQGGFHGNALQAASSEGYRDLIQLLLDKGADINAQGGFHSNALQIASVEGHQDVIQLLLDKGADINAQGGFYSNALQAVSFKGYRGLVQLLLDKGADTNAQGGYYSKAL